MNRLEEIKAVFDSQGLVTNADIAAELADWKELAQ